MKTQKGNLTPRQECLMNFLWKENQAMTSGEMADKLSVEGWNSVTLFKNVQMLVDEGFLKVDGVKKTGKTYARKLVPSISKVHYYGRLMAAHGLNEQDLPEIVAAMIGVHNEKDEEARKEDIRAAIKEGMRGM